MLKLSNNARGKDTLENLQFLDKNFNRAIGKRINDATKDLPTETKVDIQFKIK
jgi:hypothetical protein